MLLVASIFIFYLLKKQCLILWTVSWNWHFQMVLRLNNSKVSLWYLLCNIVRHCGTFCKLRKRYDWAYITLHAHMIFHTSVGFFSLYFPIPLQVIIIVRMFMFMQISIFGSFLELLNPSPSRGQAQNIFMPANITSIVCKG